MNAFRDRRGQRFGKLIVLSQAAHKHGHVRWVCVCDCGRVTTVSSSALRVAQSCGCTRAKARVERVGQRFGKLVVLERGPRGKNTRWLCLCDCGNKVTVDASSLKRGTHSCGCARYHKGKDHYKWGGRGSLTGSYWASLCKGAADRDIEITITINDAWDQFVKQNGECALTGVTLTFAPCPSKRGKEQTASLDRIDSGVGYVPGNIQWVHKTIQLMKNKYSQEEFIAQATAVARHEHVLSLPEPVLVSLPFLRVYQSLQAGQKLSDR